MKRSAPGGKKNPLGQSRWEKQSIKRDQRKSPRFGGTDPDAWRFDAKPSEAMPPISNREPIQIENPEARIWPKEYRFRIVIFNNNIIVAIRYFDTREMLGVYQRAWYQRWNQYLNKLTYSERQDLRMLALHPWGISSDQIQASWQPIPVYTLERQLHPEGDFEWPFTGGRPWISLGMHFLELERAAAWKRQESSATVTRTRQFDLSEDHL